MPAPDSAGPAAYGDVVGFEVRQQGLDGLGVRIETEFSDEQAARVPVN